jgi:hypothetical protein
MRSNSWDPGAQGRMLAAAMAIDLSQAFVLGLLAELQRHIAELQHSLAAAQGRAERLEAVLTTTAQRYRGAQAAVQAAREAGMRAATRIADANAALASLTREIATLEARAAGFAKAAQGVREGPVLLELRRSRAELMVQATARGKRAAAQRLDAEQARATLQASERDKVVHGDTLRLVEAELLRLQDELPAPQTTMQLFEAKAAQAHCTFYLEGQPQQWRQQLKQSCDDVLALHTALRAGRYPLEQNSEVLGGRARATVEALYAYVALDDVASACALFAAATDSALFFHHIDNVFLTWCLGLYVTGDHPALRSLVQLHLYAAGPRGTYAQAFAALLQGDATTFGMALRRLVQTDWRLLRRLPQRGLGVVNVRALALCRLAQVAGLAWESAGVPGQQGTGKPNTGRRGAGHPAPAAAPAADLGPTVPKALRFLQ